MRRLGFYPAVRVHQEWRGPAHVHAIHDARQLPSSCLPHGDVTLSLFSSCRGAHVLRHAGILQRSLLMLLVLSVLRTQLLLHLLSLLTKLRALPRLRQPLLLRMAILVSTPLLLRAFLLHLLAWPRLGVSTIEQWDLTCPLVAALSLLLLRSFLALLFKVL